MPSAGPLGRRKSGRVVQKPILYQTDPNISITTHGSVKRKRTGERATPEQGGDDDDEDDDIPGEESSPDEDDSEPDEEELKEQRRRSRAKKEQSKPASKKLKTTRDGAVRLPMRPAAGPAKRTQRPQKRRGPRKQSTPTEDATGLYADVFSSGKDADEAATEWLTRYNEHNAQAMCDLVNLVLRCTGCHLSVNVHDIEDPDNATNRLGDLQEEFQAQKPTDYPLISKAKGGSFSRAAMTAFFASVVEAAHESGVLYDDVALIENIEVWVTAMSSSSLRPFRHTATVVALSIVTSLCHVMRELVESAATTMRQKDGEAKKKTVNKGRVAALRAKSEESEERRRAVEDLIKDLFDIVFVHRYRDVDPKVRVDCSTALGNWIATCPDLFFEGTYLRYLGWVLSDDNPQTRGEVVKQLTKLYKQTQNVGRLRAFTERFKPRMIEMAVQDAEVGVRASTVELLDLIRGLGFLEPEDIDTIGKLVFDTQPRARRAVAGFFAQNINDLFEAAVEELGGEEALDEALGEDAGGEDYDAPRKSWLKLKCLAEVLDSYDEDSAGISPADHALVAESLIATGMDSRYTMAAEVVCEGVKELQDWEVLAGYLLHDHSSGLPQHGDSDGLQNHLARCKPKYVEERLLLEILIVAVKARLTSATATEADKKGRRSKARAEESLAVQESTALRLAAIVPRLLGKFGADPETATTVLRMEHILNLEIFQALRQDSTEYTALLDDIGKQFLTHANHEVLKEASTALLHAREFEDLAEVAEGKVQDVWESTVGELRRLEREPAHARNSELANTLSRICNLAKISNCVETFEAEPRERGKTSTEGEGGQGTILDILRGLVRIYSRSGKKESDSLVLSAMQALSFYYMWKIAALRKRLETNEPIDEVPRYDGYAALLEHVIDQRPALDELRLAATGCLLNLHAAFSGFRMETGRGGKASSDALAGLVREVSPETKKAIRSSFVAAERAFARKSRRVLEPVHDDDGGDDEDELPEAPESEPEDEDEDEDERSAQLRRQQEVLLAEKRLCDITGSIVLASVAGVLDASGRTEGGLRKRLLRYRTKLGPNFKEVVAYLDAPKEKRTPKAKQKPVTAAAAAAAAAEGGVGNGHAKRGGAFKSREMVEDGDDDDDEVEEEGGEEEEDALEEDGEEALRRREILEVEDEEGDDEIMGD